MPATGDKNALNSGLNRVPVERLQAGERTEFDDSVAVEEPMEVRVASWDQDLCLVQSIAVTMRTPGHDFELAVGFLFTEGIIQQPNAIAKVEYANENDEGEACNRVVVSLKKGVPFDGEQLSRHVFTNSSCGICGRITIEQIRARNLREPHCDHRISSELLGKLPQLLVSDQSLFQQTGGIHASGLFDTQGNLQILREDVGRHNAMDKLIGSLYLEDKLPADNRILLISGRAGFELVQKAIIAGIPVLAAIGAPTSLAVSLAREFDMTLIGFLKPNRFNIYSGGRRIQET